MPDPHPITRLNAALEGRYRVERELGAGGMATVYVADDLKHERKVALKVLKPELAAVVGAERFLAEIKTTANLQHPHILPLHDSGEADGLLFYVMPYVQGESLRERLGREHQLPVDEAVRIAENLAEALDYAHRQGIIHRDIKPANVLLQEGKPVISDFGIALAVGAAGGGRLTETGLSLGTPHYMSPEQATGDQSVGPATDIYALGCVMYEMLVGEPPFTGSTPQAVLGRIITGETPSATAERSTVPRNVDAAITKALEKVPADRFSRAADLRRALAEPTFRHRDWEQARTGSSSSWTVRVLAALWVALAGAFLWWTATSRDTGPPQTMRLTTLLPPDQGLAGPQQLRLSSDGSMIVYSGPSEDDGEWQLWTHRWAEGTGRAVPNTTGVYFFDPSPGNDEVALVSEGAVRVQALDSDAVRTLVPDGVHCCVTWSDEDHWIYYTDGAHGVSRVSPNGGAPEVLTTVGDDYAHEWPSPIPGTDLVVFERAGFLGLGSRIALLELGSGDIRDLVAGANPIPFGDQILFTTEANRPELRYVNGLSQQIVVTTIATSIGGDVVSGRPTFDASPSGHLLYARAHEALGVPVWVERNGIETPIGSDPARPLSRVRLSPDDSRLLLMEFTSGFDAAIYAKELPDGPRVSVAPSPSGIRAFWAHDGSAIYYVRYVTSDTGSVATEIRRVRPDGAGEPEDVGLPWPEAMMSPDGEWWIYRTPNGPPPVNGDLMAVRTSLETEPIPLAASESQEAEPALSRDGRWLAYSSDQSGVRQVYVQAFPEAGDRHQITANGGLSPAFSPGTDELFVVEGGWMVAYAYDAEPTFRVRGREPLFDVSKYVFGNWGRSHDYDVNRDGTRFAMIRLVDSGQETSSTVELLLNYMTTLEGQAAR